MLPPLVEKENIFGNFAEKLYERRKTWIEKSEQLFLEFLRISIAFLSNAMRHSGNIPETPSACIQIRIQKKRKWEIRRHKAYRQEHSAHLSRLENQPLNFSIRSKRRI